MFFVETCVFLLFLGGCCLWAILRDHFAERRDHKRAIVISATVEALAGQPIETVKQRFGDPYEHFAGSSGRSLYVWKSPPSAAFPPHPGVLVMTLTTGPDNRVETTTWRRQ